MQNHEQRATRFSYAASDLMQQKYPNLPFTIYDEDDAVIQIRNNALRRHLKRSDFKNADLIQEEIENDDEQPGNTQIAYEIFGEIGDANVDTADQDLRVLTYDFQGKVISFSEKIISHKKQWEGLIVYDGKLNYPNRFIVTTVLFE